MLVLNDNLSIRLTEENWIIISLNINLTSIFSLNSYSALRDVEE